MSSEFWQTENMLEIISKNFLSAYKWLIYSKQNNIEWCMRNTKQIMEEAIYLRKLFFKQINSGIGKRLAKKCTEWYVYFETFGMENKRTIKRFRRLICGIADTDIDNYHLVENFLFNDDENDDKKDPDYYSIVRTNTRNRHNYLSDVILGNIGFVHVQVSPRRRYLETLFYLNNKEETSRPYAREAAMTSMQTNNSQLKRTEVSNDKEEKCEVLKYFGQFSYARVRTELGKADEICPLNDDQEVNTKNHENYVNMNTDTGAKGVDLQDNYDDEIREYLEIQYERVDDEDSANCGDVDKEQGVDNKSSYEDTANCGAVDKEQVDYENEKEDNVEIEDLFKDNYENYVNMDIDTDEEYPAIYVTQTDTSVDVSLDSMTAVPEDVGIHRAKDIDGGKILPYRENVVERKYQSLKIEDSFVLRKDVLLVQQRVHGPGVQHRDGVWAQPVAYQGHQIWDPGIRLACDQQGFYVTRDDENCKKKKNDN